MLGRLRCELFYCFSKTIYFRNWRFTGSTDECRRNVRRPVRRVPPKTYAELRREPFVCWLEDVLEAARIIQPCLRSLACYHSGAVADGVETDLGISHRTLHCSGAVYDDVQAKRHGDEESVLLSYIDFRHVAARGWCISALACNGNAYSSI